MRNVPIKVFGEGIGLGDQNPDVVTGQAIHHPPLWVPDTPRTAADRVLRG
jgi:hypothetical protein